MQGYINTLKKSSSPIVERILFVCPCLFFFSFCMRSFEVEKIYCGYSDNDQQDLPI